MTKGCRDQVDLKKCSSVIGEVKDKFLSQSALLLKLAVDQEKDGLELELLQRGH